ncbi:MAG: ATP-binding cassette domain-containing protein, partial [Firmicutes bacterium]|nr:ATP-binding cassette domain-containing protein [Bacillota bacterium]
MFAVENLHFTYPKNKEETIKGISFHIAKGEIYGFLGPSGAGKSTTQKILIKLLDRYSGAIMYDGTNIAEIDDRFFEKIGVSFEMPIHFSKMTAMENINFFLKLYQKNADVEA